MEYRVILLKNGEYLKTFHKAKTRRTSFKKYHSIKEENVVYFPKKFINYDGIIPVEYKICVVKEFEEGDEPRWVRDDFGRLHEEQLIDDKWLIIDSAPYDFEETFWAYGYNSRTDRLKISDIMRIMLNDIFNPRSMKHLIVVHNKLVIYNENHFDMIICKCKRDAQRLHHELKRVSDDRNIKNLMFSGTAQGATISNMYDLIHERTGWPMTKIRRTSTRP